jgi:hypothetical protein
MTMKLCNTFLVIVVAAACSRGGSETRAVSADEARSLLIDRNWMDLWPETDTQPLHVFRFVPTMGGGVFQDRTLYAGQFELFTFRVDGDRIHFDLPHTKDRVTAKFRIERVDGPHPFDLRLTLDPSPRGPSVYYGRSAETLEQALRLR